jgi:hypothetical protein
MRANYKNRQFPYLEDSPHHGAGTFKISQPWKPSALEEVILKGYCVDKALMDSSRETV